MPVGTENKRGTKTRSVDDHQLVVFKIANEEFGVDINEVKEIIRWTDVTRIPSTESYIKGVINLRGNIVVVNDLAMKLGLPSKEIDDETRILVVEVGENNTVGMVVDSATEVLRLDGEKVKAPPEMVIQGIDQQYIDGVGVLDEKRLLTLLDLAKVMKSQDYEKILKAQKIAEQNIKKKEKKSKTDKKEEHKPTKKEEKTEENKKNDDTEENKENKDIKDGLNKEHPKKDAPKKELSDKSDSKTKNKKSSSDESTKKEETKNNTKKSDSKTKNKKS